MVVFLWPNLKGPNLKEPNNELWQFEQILKKAENVLKLHLHELVQLS
jgi:hypothetical protein